MSHSAADITGLSDIKAYARSDAYQVDKHLARIQLLCDVMRRQRSGEFGIAFFDLNPILNEVSP